ncbi:Protein of unknown function [Gryllus bimaculatus]|nr:Protein of unknown function [Gryllus bimaculatus]
MRRWCSKQWHTRAGEGCGKPGGLGASSGDNAGDAIALLGVLSWKPSALYQQGLEWEKKERWTGGDSCGTSSCNSRRHTTALIFTQQLSKHFRVACHYVALPVGPDNDAKDVESAARPAGKRAGFGGGGTL